MAFFLEILDGDLKGTRTPLSEGLTIGRSNAQLTIRDSKISSKHAKVEKRADGTWWMVDLGSQNGIKSGPTRTRELKLDPGVTFTLGRTSLQIVSTEHSQPGETSIGAVTVTRTFWDGLRDVCLRAAGESKVVKREIASFDPVLKLKFIKGIQAGTEWTIGYGPRMVGSSSIDLALEDAALPGVCFRLEPQHRGVLFKNETEREVRLNGKWLSSEFLKHGDVIEIMNTQIQVVFDEIG